MAVPPMAWPAPCAPILASNPHDTQPWLFKLEQGKVALIADRTRNLGSFDPFRREMHLGVGAAVENLVLAARAFGFAANVVAMEGKLAVHRTTRRQRPSGSRYRRLQPYASNCSKLSRGATLTAVPIGLSPSPPGNSHISPISSLMTACASPSSMTDRPAGSWAH